MPTLSIEQLNARRDRINRNRDTARLGGSNRKTGPSAETLKAWAKMDAAYVPSLEDKVAAVFSEFRSWCRERTPLALMLELGADEIPF